MKQFLLKKIKDLTKEDLTIRYLNIFNAAKVKYVFELVFFNERMIKWRGFSEESLKELHKFYEKNGFSFEVLNVFLISFFNKIGELKIVEIPELNKSLVFRNLIKDLKNPNLDYEKTDEFGKKFVYSIYTPKMVSKLNDFAEDLPYQKISFFYKPNQDFPVMEINYRFRSKTEKYNIPVGNFQKRIEKYFIKELIKELEKPDD